MPIEILMPALSPTMTEGTLAKWTKKEGDAVGPGDVIAEIETDKATMEVEAVEEGVIGKILVKDGTQGVKVNACIALLLEEGEDASAVENYTAAKAPVANDTPASETATEDDGSDAVTSAPNAPAGAQLAVGLTPPPVVTIPDNAISKDHVRVNVSPLARRYARESGIVLENVQGTGPKGRITKSDVERAKQQYGVSRAIVRADSEVTIVPVDMMRKTIAERLLQSKQHVPHFYLTMDASLDALMKVRGDLNGAASKTEDGKPSYKVSVNDMIIKASALAMKDIPEANASWSDQGIVMYNNVDVSVAVAIDGGLITPIVRNADQKTLLMVSQEMKSLAKRAKEGKLAPEEFQGGGFSISNLGMYGVKQFNAIVNPPQSCILAVGAGEERAMVRDGKILSESIVTLSISCDHRVVDGAVGAEFLGRVKYYLEHPATLLV